VFLPDRKKRDGHPADAVKNSTRFAQNQVFLRLRGGKIAFA